MKDQVYSSGDGSKRIPTLIRPHPNWGPALDKYRTGDYRPLIAERELREMQGKPPPYSLAISGDTVSFTPSSGYGHCREGAYNRGFEHATTEF